MPNDTDVFISYAHADQEWVRVLAENLHQSGLNVFYDEWEIGAGDVLVHKLDAGILNTRNGVVVVSPTSLTRPWVQEEYAAMLTRAVAGKQRLIPVLLKDAELPPFMASRVWVDFRHADGPVYLQRVEELVRALKGERRGPPPRTGTLKPPPGTGFRAEGKTSACLRIGDGEAKLSGGESGEVREPIAGVDDRLRELLWEQQRALRRAGTAALRDAGRDGVEPVLGALGQRLGQAFLPPKVAATLDSELTRAVQHNATLELALEIADQAVVDLPWETLRLPSDAAAPLALHPRIDLYRRVPLDGPSPAISIPGPLRVLVAIGSPEAQNARGELLDMEAELKIILDAIEPARRTGRATARILERGSVEAIRAALEHQRYHVLYISCHAGPGELLLEDADGCEDRVTAERFWRDALPADRGVPLIVLAGCATAREGTAAAGDDEKRLPSLARDLIAHGVPGVIAMQAPVTDTYATDLAGALFQALATWQEPAPLHALAEARRRLEQKRVEDTSPRQPPPEWPTPALYAAASPLPLYDPTIPFEELPPPVEPVLDRGVVVRRVGDFVGRRREERLMLRALRADDGAGVLLHGIGGVGKSTLAAQVLHRLAQDGWLLVSLSGPADPDQVLDALGLRLFELCLTEGRDERDPLRQIANAVREPKLPWEQRLSILVRHVFAQTPLVFLFDNFEDNLDAGRRPKDDLADLLARWAEQPGKGRLLFTCRYPFNLPDDSEDRLEPLHLGPLSPGETRKLVLRLDGLAKLQPDELAHAYEEVGGHPRALEYLDALLRGGHARFPDVERRLKAALQARNVPDPSKWRADTAGGLDQALAETATLAADDVLLDELLRQLDPEPLARRLLIGASVYRVPIDRTGLGWQVGEIVQPPQGPSQQPRKEPPIKEPESFPEAITILQSLSLLAPVQYTDDNIPHYVVHRWTARALAQRASGKQLADAHRCAAGYWRWRVQVQPQSRGQAIEDLLEARYHHYEAGDMNEAIAVTHYICSHLHTWGAWQREERLCREALAWIPDRSIDAADFLHELGAIAHRRGDYDRALDHYRNALKIRDALGDRRGMAGSYHQLGIVAQERGEYDRALESYRKSLGILKALGDRPGMADCYHQLGNVMYLRGDYAGALDHYRNALKIRDALGDRPGAADSYQALGMIAHDQGDYDRALGWYHDALKIRDALGDRPGTASCYHELGMVAHRRKDYDRALGWYRKSLDIFEELGVRTNVAVSYHALGMVAQDRGDYDRALDWYHKSLEIKKAIGDRHGMARTISQIGVLYTERGEAAAAVPYNLRSLAIRLKISAAEARIDLRWLSRQREALAAERFRHVLSEHLSEADAARVIELLDE